MILPIVFFAPDLSIQEAPPRAPHSLRLRAQVDPASLPETTIVEDEAEPDTWRDAEERLVVRFQLGWASDQAPLSGDARLDGRVPGDLPGDLVVPRQELRTGHDYLLGDAVLGSRGVPVASLSSYFAAQFRLSHASQNATVHDVWDSQGDADLLIQTGWAEYEAHGFRLRAGRQFHHGTAMFAAQFDGGTLAWEQPDYEVTAFVGRRAAIYLDDSPGILGGGGARVRLKRLTGWPVDLAADVLSYESQLFVESSARVQIREGNLSVSARALDKGDGMGLGRLSARARYPLSPRLFARADAAYVLSHEVSYDYLASEPTDITTGGIALALPEPQDSLRLGGGLSVLVAPGLEAYGFGRANLADSNGFDSTWAELGVAVDRRFSAEVSASAQARVRANRLDEAGAGDELADLSATGVKGFRELSAELRFPLIGTPFRCRAGAWVRAYDYTGPYVEIDGDTRLGGRFSGEAAISRRWRAFVVAEAAQPSPARAPELATQYSLRGIAEVAF